MKVIQVNWVDLQLYLNSYCQECGYRKECKKGDPNSKCPQQQYWRQIK